MGGGKKRLGEESNYVLNIGSDESQNGSSRAVFVVVFSGLEQDVMKGQYDKEKARENLWRNFNNNRSYRDYSFLVLNEKQAKNFGDKRMMGNVLTSLLVDDVWKGTEEISLFQDSRLGDKESENTINMLSYNLNISRDNLHVYHGAGFDERYGVTSFADAIASYFYNKIKTGPKNKGKKGIPSWIYNHPNRREFRKFDQ